MGVGATFTSVALREQYARIALEDMSFQAGCPWNLYLTMIRDSIPSWLSALKTCSQVESRFVQAYLIYSAGGPRSKKPEIKSFMGHRAAKEGERPFTTVGCFGHKQPHFQAGLLRLAMKAAYREAEPEGFTPSS